MLNSHHPQPHSNRANSTAQVIGRSDACTGDQQEKKHRRRMLKRQRFRTKGGRGSGGGEEKTVKKAGVCLPLLLSAEVPVLCLGDWEARCNNTGTIIQCLPCGETVLAPDKTLLETGHHVHALLLPCAF